VQVERQEWDDDRESRRSEEAADEEMPKSAILLEEDPAGEDRVDPVEHRARQARSEGAA
jgi:hypothetical protein